MTPRSSAFLVLVAGALGAAALLWAAAPPVVAGEIALDPSVVAGREILAENGCNGACHQSRVKGGDPMTLYTRTTRRVNSTEELKRQVEMCISLLNAQIFPEDVDKVVTALDHDAYHFD